MRSEDVAARASGKLPVNGDAVQGQKSFKHAIRTNNFCMPSAKIGPKELAKMPHITSASTAMTMRRPTVKELQVTTLLTCDVTASTYSVRETVAINQRQSHMFEQAWHSCSIAMQKFINAAFTETTRLQILSKKYLHTSNASYHP
jgi:hypothetical protein